ncbi:hypothetical protein Q7P35_002393 [Cladosporium inversicolor]
MSVDPQAAASGPEPDDALHRHHQPEPEDATQHGQEEDEEDDEDEEDEEPKLKYAKLTGSLAGVYRNGDFTTAFCVAGDKMIMGTQDGNIHALSVPTMENIRTYHAHSASITSCSVSPVPPPPTLTRTPEGNAFLAPNIPAGKAESIRSTATGSTKQARAPQPVVPNIPTNQIYIATASIDGHVCVSSLVDPKDVQLRNFARPVQAVALSPDYKTDRTYLSGGRAGSLILTVGGKSGVSSDANTNSTAAAASGWLGSMGLGSNNGKDTILHQGEGTISTIKWSMSGKWVVWVNEEGIKIMRSHLRLDSESSEDAWKRIAHASKPNRKSWEDMAGVWKARAEWIDDRLLESDDLGSATEADKSLNGGLNGTPKKREKKFEKLVVGWGDTTWIMHVHEGGKVPSGKNAGQRQIGSADIIHKLQFRDCIVSGLSLYTPTMLAILAYRTRDDDDNPLPTVATNNDTPRKSGRQHRHTSLAPQLRLVNVKDGEEVDLDELSVSRFETLSAQDYHLGTLFIPPPLPEKATKEQKSALEGLWEISGGGYATRMFTSGANALTRTDSSKEGSNRGGTSTPRSGSIQGVTPTPPRQKTLDAHPYTAEAGLKLFIQSPFDCVLAVKRELSDHLSWLLEHHQYDQAWTILDEHPEIIDPSTADRKSLGSVVESPSKPQKNTLADFFADSDSTTTVSAARAHDSISAKEKRRIGDLWLGQLVAADKWSEAGKAASKVLEGSARWEHWVFTFAQADKFDEITPYVPATVLQPPLPSEVYEIILGHYIVSDPPRLGKLLDQWDADLFDVHSIITAIESRLRSRDVSEQSVQDGVQGRDWRILLDALAKLYLANAQPREALRCFILTQNYDAAMNLIRDEKIAETLSDDIPGFLTLKVSKEQLRSADLSELEESSAEPVALLVDEALRGSISPVTVIEQLLEKDDSMRMFLFFYLRALWNGGSKVKPTKTRRSKFDFNHIDQGHAMVEDHADLAVDLFAEYDRDLLLQFLQASEVYSYDKAANICEQRHYIPELVHVLSKTGQLKRALWLIIGELGDVKKAIEFVKVNPDLWDDLLEYGMDKPAFIRGLLEEVGTAVDPAELVRRIPVGLEIEGLKQGIMRLVKEYEIQYSISEGVAKVLEGEVAMGMDTLRAGQKKAVRFEVVHESPSDIDLVAHDVPTQVEGEALPVPKRRVPKGSSEAKPGHCVGCGEPFSLEGMVVPNPFAYHHPNCSNLLTPATEALPLLGFACGHVYHLPCLLRANPDTDDDATVDRLMTQLGYGSSSAEDSDEPAYTGRSVGGKVAHAHVVRNVVQGGCRCCVVPDGA